MCITLFNVKGIYNTAILMRKNKCEFFQNAFISELVLKGLMVSLFTHMSCSQMGNVALIKKDHMQSTMDSLPEWVCIALIIAEALHSVKVFKQGGR